MDSKKIICRLKGGLGNQLFCYAAARYLAILSNSELVLDTKTGFKRDFLYKRNFALDNFNLAARLADKCERLEPFERLNRALIVLIKRFFKFSIYCDYRDESEYPFDPTIFKPQKSKRIILDGYFQNEIYFKPIESIIRSDLRLNYKFDSDNESLFKKIINSNSVAIHFRNFEKIGESNINNMRLNYYVNAIKLLRSKYEDLFFFVFSDDVISKEKIDIIGPNYHIVDNHSTHDSDYIDLMLMSSCKHFITANSTFSWWAAWLGSYPDKIVFCPKKEENNKIENLPIFPPQWIQVELN